jgi:hypothetical protein
VSGVSGLGLVTRVAFLAKDGMRFAAGAETSGLFYETDLAYPHLSSRQILRLHVEHYIESFTHEK